jgi:hypothetical protein
MSISGERLLAATALRARSRVLPGRILLRLVVLVGGAIAAVLLGASVANADGGSGNGSGIGASLNHVLGQHKLPSPPKVVPPETVTTPVHVVAKKVAAPRVHVAPKVHAAPKPKSAHRAAHSVDAVAPVVAQARKHVQKAAAKLTGSIADIAENPQPTQGILAVDRVVDHVVDDASGLVQDTVGDAAATVSQVSRASTELAPIPAPSAVGPQQAAPVEGPSPVAATGHGRAAHDASWVAEFPVLTGNSSSVRSPATPRGADVALPQGAPTGTPSQIPNLPTVPAQGPVVQTSPGQPTGELAVLDVVLHDGQDGTFRPLAGDETVPSSRADLVDTRPA